MPPPEILGKDILSIQIAAEDKRYTDCRGVSRNLDTKVSCSKRSRLIRKWCALAKTKPIPPWRYSHAARHCVLTANFGKCKLAFTLALLADIKALEEYE
jgi:hypothetical protein